MSNSPLKTSIFCDYQCRACSLGVVGLPFGKARPPSTPPSVLLGVVGLRFGKGRTPSTPPSVLLGVVGLPFGKARPPSTPPSVLDRISMDPRGRHTKSMPSCLTNHPSKRCTHPGKFGRQGGFTLLEVLVASLILSISLLAVHQAFSSALLTNHTTDQLWRVLRFVNQELARIERAPQSPRVAVTQGVYPPGHPFANHRWRRSVTNYQPFPGVTIKRVAFKIEWGGLKNPRSYTATLNLPAN